MTRDLIRMSPLFSGSDPSATGGMPPSMATPQPAAAARKPRVLIIEDDAAAAGALGDLLRFFGCVITRAPDVGSAKTALKAAPFDFVLLDLMLPDGDGTAVLDFLRTHQLAARVAVISATADPMLLQRTRAYNPDAIFPKPLDFPKLAAFMSLRRTGG